MGSLRKKGETYELCLYFLAVALQFLNVWQRFLKLTLMPQSPILKKEPRDAKMPKVLN